MLLPSHSRNITAVGERAPCSYKAKRRLSVEGDLSALFDLGKLCVVFLVAVEADDVTACGADNLCLGNSQLEPGLNNLAVCICKRIINNKNKWLKKKLKATNMTIPDFKNVIIG